MLPVPPLQHYTSCSRNSIRSRAWGAKLEGCSYKVQVSAAHHVFYHSCSVRASFMQSADVLTTRMTTAILNGCHHMHCALHDGRSHMAAR